MVYIRFFTHSVLLISFLFGWSDALATDTASQLQTSAIGRIDAFIDHFRKTGDFQSKLSDLDVAEQELLLSRAAFLQQKRLTESANNLVRLGQIQRMRGQWQPAIDYYRQAEEEALKAKDIAIQTRALNGLAQVQISVPDLGNAEKSSAQAVQLSEGTSDAKLRFDALDIAAQVQIAQGNHNAALALLNRALEATGGIEDQSPLFYGYLDRADTYLKMAEKCDVDRSFEPCLQAVELSRADYLAAQQIANKLGYTSLANSTAGFLNRLEVRKQLITRQEAFDATMRKAQIFSPKTTENILITEHFVSGEAFPPGMETLYESLTAENKKAGGFADASLARSSFIDGMIQQSKGQHDAALASFLAAVYKQELDRGKLRDERDRGTFMEDKIVFYNAAILQLLEHHRYPEAFELLERSRARSMADLLASRPPELSRPEELALYGQTMNLKAKIAENQSKLTLLANDGGQQAARKLEETKTAIAQLENQLTLLNGRLEKEAPRLGQLLQSSVTPLADLQKAMRDENFEMLQYMALEHGLILWHINGDDIHVLNVFIPRSQLQEKIRKLKDSLSNPNVDFDQQSARELYLFLIEPAKKWIKSEHLVIVPHEDLYSLPFQALINPENDRFAGESYALSYAPSATVLLGLHRSGPMMGGKLLAVANPKLIAAAPEVNAIAALYPDNSRVFVESLAGETEIKTQVGAYEIIHLAVHGKFVANEPMLSYLELSPEGTDDGKLTAAEMFGLQLNQSKLVVLSACETAKASVNVGNEVQGMLRALLYAGAPALVMSYWQVDSEATAQWMTDFYKAAQSLAPADAAKQAIVALKAQPRFAHPYYWAAFMTIAR